MTRYVRLHVQPFCGRDDTPASAAWLPCLEIPIHRLPEFSLKPYRWLCYAGYCIMGAEGDLSFTPDCTTGFDYDVPFNPCDLYYHPRGPIFPIDPDVENASHSDIDSVSPFRTSILERDKSCVAAGMNPSSCRDAHLIPQSQGGQYIEAFTKGRGGDIIDDIDDPRNGVLVNAILYMHLGRRAAILQTPNFIMKTTDVNLRTASDDTRWTLHSFAEPTPRIPYYDVPAGQALRVPPIGERDTWPPHSLFAALYASALITTWCAPNFLTQVKAHWSNSFYPGAQQSRDEVIRKARIRRDKAADDIDAFDVLVMLQEMAAYNAAHGATSELQSAQKANDDAREKVLPWLHGVQ
ncbi:hypothetical protein EDD85DRAFT_849666 [Armillaria nabsnona]|nr:hypothetical protein EDD85DRAFT_849666 [Armillaria nabsnona]